jgi:lipoprotein-anchoring transpeptidase ErfK/SrfK
MMKTLVTVVAVALAAVSATACGAHPGSGDPTRAQAVEQRHDADALLPGASWIATAEVPEIAVYGDPDDDQPSHRLTSPDENGTPLVFLVDTPDGDEDWLPVLLPVRPNGSRGWIRAKDVELTQTQYRIQVELAAHRLTVRRGPDVVVDTPIGVGGRSTPTPDGRYYVKELLRPPTPDTVYGPYVFGLSGFSNVLTSFAGDDEAVIGIHGNNDPSSIGGNVSHGCIRLPNDVVTRMTELIPLGTPVDIRP